MVWHFCATHELWDLNGYQHKLEVRIHKVIIDY